MTQLPSGEQSGNMSLGPDVSCTKSLPSESTRHIVLFCPCSSRFRITKCPPPHSENVPGKRYPSMWKAATRSRPSGEESQSRDSPSLDKTLPSGLQAKPCPSDWPAPMETARSGSAADATTTLLDHSLFVAENRFPSAVTAKPL